MEKNAQLFQDDNGNVSSMRVMSMLALLAAVYLAVINADSDIIALFLVAAFAPKTVQKLIEVKFSKP